MGFRLAAVCMWADSWLLQDSLHEKHHRQSLSPSFHNVNLVLSFTTCKKKHQTVAQGGWENDYNTVEGEAVSRLNLKWKAFHIRFLRKIPFHTYTNRSVPCSIMSTVCVYPLRWLMRCASVTFFPAFCPHRKQVGGNLLICNWGECHCEYQHWSKCLVRSVASNTRNVDFFSSSAEILISVYFKLSSLPHYMCGSER